MSEPATKIDFKDSKYATGRRKKSIAKIWLKKGSGKIYVNGSNVTTSQNLSSFSTIPNASDELYIGETETGHYNPFLGNIDEFAIWVGAELSASDISTLYNSGVPTNLSSFSTPPTHWWRMGDDNNDKVSKENSISSQSNRIYDQIGVSHLTPQRFRSASSGIHDVKKYPDGFIDDLVEMIDSIPGFSLEKFCQLLLLMTMNMMIMMKVQHYFLMMPMNLV